MRIYFVYSSHHSDILREENCRVLVCYPYMRDMFKSEPDIPSGFKEVLVDSGGFQLQTGVAEVYLGAYALWLNMLLPRHPEIVGFMNLDLLGDAIGTLENQVYMESQGLHPIPTWHSGEPEEYLSYYCERYPWVSVGGLISKTTPSKASITNLVNKITQTYPDTKFHLFGIGLSAALAFKQSRVYSVDFSTWSTVMRFGHEIVLDKKQFVKEVQLKEEDRNRLKVDEEFQREMVRRSVKNILYFEEEVNKLQDTDHQLVMQV